MTRKSLYDSKGIEYRYDNKRILVMVRVEEKQFYINLKH